MVSSFSFDFKRSGGSGELWVECGWSGDHHYRLDLEECQAVGQSLRRLLIEGKCRRPVSTEHAVFESILSEIFGPAVVLEDWELNPLNRDARMTG